MAKHFKPAKENSLNTAENTRWIAVNRGTTNPREMFEDIDLDNLPDGCDGIYVDGECPVIHIADLFYEGVERVYIFDKNQLHYRFDEED